MSRQAVGVGVIGLGFMGRTHVAAWQRAGGLGDPCRLVAVCDRSEARRRGEVEGSGNLATGAGDRLFDPAEVRACAEPADLFADSSVEVVSICTPTDSHVALASAALRAGKHVLLEKPVAIRSGEVEALIEVAEDSGRLCMPAMCMRFWPGWAWLKERIDDRSFGAVRSASFTRLGCRPAWGGGFYADVNRSGGALFDLHIHDVDFIRYCFGEPVEVRSSGCLDHLTTLYRFADGPVHVRAEGGWDHTPGFGFRMRYVVVFEEATAEFELGRTPAVTLSRDGVCEAVEVPSESGYQAQVRHFLRAVGGLEPLRATLADALLTTRLLEAERRGLG